MVRIQLLTSFKRLEINAKIEMICSCIRWGFNAESSNTFLSFSGSTANSQSFHCLPCLTLNLANVAVQRGYGKWKCS